MPWSIRLLDINSLDFWPVETLDGLLYAKYAASTPTMAMAMKIMLSTAMPCCLNLVFMVNLLGLLVGLQIIRVLCHFFIATPPVACTFARKADNLIL